MSKFSFEVLNQRVFPHTATNDPDVLLGAAFGEDVALTQVGDEILASHVDPIVGAVAGIGWLAVHVACNDIAASGISPRWILLLVLLPSADDEELLESVMSDANHAAREIGVSIVGGHTGYSAGLLRPLVAVTALGTASGRSPVRSNGARPGDHVLVTKGIALEGTGILAQDFADVARELGLSDRDLAEGCDVMKSVSVLPEALLLADNGASSMHDVTRGGLLETLLEIAHLSGVGIEIDAGRLPVPSIVARFAEAFRFDPAAMISSGTLAVTVPDPHLAAAENALNNSRTPFAVVGRVTEGHGPFSTVEVRKWLTYSDVRIRKIALSLHFPVLGSAATAGSPLGRGRRQPRVVPCRRRLSCQCGWRNACPNRSW
jgi:hydrogenase expression/formation protein HypE